jgi:uncharacterized protein YcgI (DUF1989 family)
MASNVKDEHHGGNDQHVNYRSGKHTGFNKEWYDNLRASKASWTKVSEKRIHQNRGIFIKVKAGQAIKFIQPEGPNIIDVWFFGADIKDPSGEKYDPVYTAVFEGFILRKNSRLWSTVPYFRPMATYIDDNIDASLMPDDETWPVWHGGHCSPEANEVGYGKLNLSSCQTNAMEGLIDAGFDFEMAEHLASTHNMCIFQPMSVKNSVMASGNVSPTWQNSPFTGSKRGTFVEYYAEMDLLIAISHCPYGDQSVPPYEVEHFPIDLEIWDTGVLPQERIPYNDWRPAFKGRLERLKTKGHTGATGRYYEDD